MVFNVMANNRDDHVKNFAFMIDTNQEWVLTPAYDLMYAKRPGGKHSMDISGEGLSPGKEEVRRLGRKTGLSTNEVNNSVERVMTAVEKWPEYAQIAGVTEKTMNYIQKRMQRNLSFFLGKIFQTPLNRFFDGESGDDFIIDKKMTNA